jgi:hypothetical protein
MEKLEIDTYFGDKPVHIEIGATMGARGGFYVTINNYYQGRVWKTNDGWRHDLNPKSELTGDDLQILIDLIEEDLMNRKSS